jgi:hypothetical protein
MIVKYFRHISGKDNSIDSQEYATPNMEKKNAIKLIKKLYNHAEGRTSVHSDTLNKLSRSELADVDIHLEWGNL